MVSHSAVFTISGHILHFLSVCSGYSISYYVLYVKGIHKKFTINRIYTIMSNISYIFLCIIMNILLIFM
nr:MAG TPA: hypothetical protein [Caudoviricetes sp.]